ncbi:unnamed protein product [Caenorhabditis auriculariae]|uniref:Vacuolar protein sorting-associated protein 16 homolog n=1 Tax=Caenorhabditis auriculariae TaxID=2777116 RepID=A0A8S1H441_9PELO|nr:unnamed protein product [Caenorhabditis auriculariae]
MASNALGEQLAANLMKAAQVLEEQLDSEMNKLENLDEDDLEVIRRKRIEQMKKAQQARVEMLSQGHGKYEEVADEKDFFEATKKSNKVVCLFYLPSNFRCKIVDKHFEILAKRHIGTRFIKIDAEKAHFLTSRLNIRVIPTIAIVLNQQTVDYIRGFDDLGGKDEFTTEVLESRLAKSEVLTIEKKRVEPQKKKIIRSGHGEYDNEEDCKQVMSVTEGKKPSVSEVFPEEIEENEVNEDKVLCKEDTSWIDVGDVKFGFTTQYENVPQLQLQNAVHFAACSYSGPIALAHTQTTSTWFVSIRTCSGRILKRKLEIPDAFAIEWTRGHCLLVVNNRGNATIYSSLGEQISDFFFSTNIRELRSLKTFVTSSDSGAAILDNEERIFVVNSVAEPVVWSMNSPTKEKPTTWTVFQPQQLLTRVLFVVGSQFYMGSQGEELAIQPQAAAWAISPCDYVQSVVNEARDRIALLTSTDKVQVVSADLEIIYASLRISQHEVSNCLSFGWVTSNGLFAQLSPSSVLLINYSDISEEEAIVYERPFKSSRIGVECDGIRVFEEDRVEFITVANDAQRAVLGVASAADGALLHEAAQWLSTPKSHQSYEYAMQIRDMKSAIDDCISSASEAWQTPLQKMLLKAARFGMAFTTSSYDTANFMRVIRELRALNELHSSRTGIPLTHHQLRAIGETCMINRLIDMGAYGVAVRVAQWLCGESSEYVDRVLMEWVRRAIRQMANSPQRYEKQPMIELEEKLSKKLLQFPHVSIADAARRAIDEKLPQLARLFIRRETDDSNHVRILLQLDDVPAALERAANAQRPQLIHQVVRHLMTGQRRAEYELAIRKIPLAQCLYQDLVRQESDGKGAGRQMLALLEQASDFERQTLYHLDAAQKEKNPSERLNSLRRAKDAAHSLGDRAIEEIINDVTAFTPSQIERRQTHMSIRDTVLEYAHDAQKIAQIRHQVKLSEKQVYLWTIEGLVKNGRMEQLFDMAQRKSPVGYVPFIKACIRYKRPEECKKYLAKVHGYADLVAANIAMKNYVEAAKMAFDRRDRETLQAIFLKSHEDPASYGKVAQLIRSL